MYQDMNAIVRELDYVRNFFYLPLFMSCKHLITNVNLVTISKTKLL